MKNGVPETESEARTLRPYIPTATLAEIARISREETAKAERKYHERNKACDTIKAIKANMQRERREIKALEAKKAQLDAQPIYVRTDAARAAAWQEAAKLRAAAIDRGETLSSETSAQTFVRTVTAAADIAAFQIAHPPYKTPTP